MLDHLLKQIREISEQLSSHLDKNDLLEVEVFHGFTAEEICAAIYDHLVPTIKSEIQRRLDQ